jgi:hypothetical protein
MKDIKVIAHITEMARMHFPANIFNVVEILRLGLIKLEINGGREDRETGA